MAIRLPVIPSFYLAGPLSSSGLVLPVSSADAAAFCTHLGAGNHTYLRISSALGLELVKATCEEGVVTILRAADGGAASTHPTGACVTVDAESICAMTDLVCELLAACPTLGATVGDALLLEGDFLTALGGSTALMNALCEQVGLGNCVATSLLANETFVESLQGLVGAELLASPSFISTLSAALVAHAPFMTAVSNALAASGTFQTAIGNALAANGTFMSTVVGAVLASPGLCAAISLCGSGGSGGGGSTCPPPTLVSPLTPLSASIGAAYNGTFVMTNATSLVVNGLPAGLTYAFDAGTGVCTIAGTPTSVGSFAATVTASNACGGVPSNVTAALGNVTVALGGGGGSACPTPTVVTPLTPASAQAGVAYTGTVQLANTTSAVGVGLPAWVTGFTFNAGTQVLTITGTPTASSTVSLRADLTNACGGGATTTIAANQALGSLSVGLQDPPASLGLGGSYTLTATFDVPSSPFIMLGVLPGGTWTITQDASTALSSSASGSPTSGNWIPAPYAGAGVAYEARVQVLGTTGGGAVANAIPTWTPLNTARYFSLTNYGGTGSVTFKLEVRAIGGTATGTSTSTFTENITVLGGGGA